MAGSIATITSLVCPSIHLFSRQEADDPKSMVLMISLPAFVKHQRNSVFPCPCASVSTGQQYRRVHVDFIALKLPAA